MFLKLCTPHEGKDDNENKLKNEQRDHISDLTTCISIRSEQLHTLLSENHDKLAQIQVDQEKIQERIQCLQQEREKEKYVLAAKLNEALINYEGQDSICVTLNLLQTLGVHLHIKSIDRLMSFVENISVKELRVLIEAGKKGDIFSCTCKVSLEELSTLWLLGDQEKCRELMSLLKGSVLNKTAKEIGLLLSVLPADKQTALCESIKEFIPNIIKDGEDFLDVVEDLSDVEGTAVCEIMKDYLPEIIKTGRDFADVMEYLFDAESAAVYEIMKDYFPEIIKTVFDCVAVLEYLSDAQATAVCEGMKDHLLGFIKTVRDFVAVLKYLPEKQKIVFYENRKELLLESIKNVEFFLAVFIYLPEEQRISFYESMQHQLPEITKNERDFVDVMAYLPNTQKKVFFESMKLKKLSKIIKKSGGFRVVLRYLTPDQITCLCKRMKDELSQHIKSCGVFRVTLEDLSVDQRAVVFESMKDRLPLMIEPAEDFCKVLEYLTDAQRAQVYNSMEDTLPSFIQDECCLQCILKYLSTDQKTALFSKIEAASCSEQKEEILKIIQTMKLDAFNNCNFSKFTDVCFFKRITGREDNGIHSNFKKVKQVNILLQA